MSRTTWRVLRAEVLRGAAPVAMSAVVLLGGFVLFINAEQWAGRWGPLAEYVRLLLLALVPLAITAAAWQAGRERRRRIGELLGSTARPPWQPVVVTWASVTLGTFGGLLLVWLGGAILVARVASYGGRGWWLTLTIAFVALAAASALGVAAGRLIPSRVAAPIVGLATYIALSALAYRDDGARWLAPSLDGPVGGAYYLQTGFQLLQGTWFAAVATALLMVTGARRRWLAVLPAAVALAAAVPIVAGPAIDRWQPDPAARELVCDRDNIPEVCVTRANAFLLDDAAPLIRDRLAQWDGVGGAPRRVVDAAARATPHLLYEMEVPPEGTIELELERFITRGGRFTAVTAQGDHLTDHVAYGATAYHARRACEFDVELTDVALGWAGGSSDALTVDDDGNLLEPEPSPDLELLLAMPDVGQKGWMGRYLAAVRSCDENVLVELAEELR